MAVRGGGERGGFGGGRPRGDSGRGGGSRARPEVGPSHEARTSRQIQIIDELCAGLKDMPVQKQTSVGQRTRFKAFVVVVMVTATLDLASSAARKSPPRWRKKKKKNEG
ncbi:hypothetical protein SO802_010023 [Lithocarpus litseifolius]|uniref:Uncharacterized protein n=1 Tax=Lithocarpus litseifolius TaxID=425828 RepID=A0AAW2DHH1_9ROSI